MLLFVKSMWEFLVSYRVSLSYKFPFLAEITRLEKEKEADLDRFEHQKDQLNNRLKQLERDSQIALAQEKQAHEEDCERLTRERVR